MRLYAPRMSGFLPLQLGDFTPPTRWYGRQLMLVSAGPEWVAQDYAAVMASRRHIKHLFGPRDSWPPDDLSIEDNLADLEWHRQEFSALRSFAYHLLDPEGLACLGCLYLYPTASDAHDAEAYLWTHVSLPREQAAQMEDEVIAWINGSWPFAAIAWPGRVIAFDAWAAAGLPNYYASTRSQPPKPAVGG